MTLKKDIRTLKGKDIPKHIQFWKSKEIERVAKLKGWEKVEWRGYGEKPYLRYQKNDKIISVRKSNKDPEGKSYAYKVIVSSGRLGNKELERWFNIKDISPALKFAKEYMEKN